MEIPVTLVESLIIAALGGVLWWLWRVEDNVSGMKLDLAKNYHSKEELRKAVDDALFPVWKEMERIARALEKIGDEQ